LNAEEQKKYRREMRLMRIGQRALARHIRENFGFKCRTEEDRGRYLDWLEDECQAVRARDTDTDDE